METRRFALCLGPWWEQLDPTLRRLALGSGSPFHSSLPERWGAELRLPDRVLPSPAVCVALGKSFSLSELTFPSVEWVGSSGEGRAAY